MSTPDGSTQQPPEQLFDDFDSAGRAEWEKKIKQTIKGDYKKQLSWQTEDGFEVLPFYTAGDMEILGTRQVFSTQTGGDWLAGQQVDCPERTKACTQMEQAVSNGADALWLVAKPKDKQTLTGLDIQSVKALNELLYNLDDRTTLIFDTGLITPYVAAGLGKLQPDFEDIYFLYDPLTNLAASGDNTLLGQHIGFAHQLIENNAQRGSISKLLGIDARHFHELGATSAQETGIALSLASEYLATFSNRFNTSPEPLLSHLFFHFGIGSSYFKELAKFRAFRFLWPYLLEGHEIDNGHVHPPYISAVNVRRNKAVYDAHTNILRSTTEAMSAIMGGCDLVVTTAFNDIFRTPDIHAQRIARNEHLLLKEEAYFNKVADPGRGSYYIEMLTKKLSETAWDFFRQIEEAGGFWKAYQSGLIPEALEKNRAAQKQFLNYRRKIMIGVNNFPNTEERMLDDYKPAADNVPIRDIQPSTQTGLKLHDITDALDEGHMLGAFYRSLVPAKVVAHSPLYRIAHHFETLRFATERYEQITGRTPEIALIPFGHPKMRSARANFASNFLGLAGYQLLKNLFFEDAKEAAAYLSNKKPDMAVLCSSDDEYLPFCEALNKHLALHDMATLWVITGRLDGNQAVFEKFGIEHFIYSGMDVYSKLKEFHTLLGINE